MNEHSYLLAVLLAVTTLVGLVGMMVADGIADIVFLVIATLPVAVGSVAWWSRRTRIKF